MAILADEILFGLAAKLISHAGPWVLWLYHMILIAVGCMRIKVCGKKPG